MQSPVLLCWADIVAATIGLVYCPTYFVLNYGTAVFAATVFGRVRLLANCDYYWSGREQGLFFVVSVLTNYRGKQERLRSTH